MYHNATKDAFIKMVNVGCNYFKSIFLQIKSNFHYYYYYGKKITTMISMGYSMATSGIWDIITSRVKKIGENPFL